jgi:Cu/Ag efflux protein CusF
MPNKYQNLLYLIGAVAVAFVIWFAAHSARKAEVKSYPLTGTVIEVHPENHSVRVHNDDMPGFMEPMAMDYEVQDEVSLQQMKKGDKIQAMLFSDHKDVWRLEKIVVQAAK